MRLEVSENPAWPTLAWVARCCGDRVELVAGSMVETGDSLACEGAWAAPFGEGALDRAAVVAGSGLVVRDGVVTFVASTSTVDRLHSIRLPDDTRIVSNSLFAVLAASGAELLPGRDYGPALNSVVNGIEACANEIETTAGPLQLTYFHNLVWDGSSLAERAKPALAARPADFGSYRRTIAGAFAELAANMADPQRRHPFSFLATLSSGYDANACAVLAAEAGCEHGLCFGHSRRGREDSGLPVAEALGLTPVLLEPGDWRRVPEQKLMPEVPILAVRHPGGLIEFHAAHERLRGTALVTGFYGDSIWNPAWPHLGPDIRRKDASGLGLCEYRLQAGFVNCAPAFWAAREVADVVAIAGSPEMARWDIGGDYTRPVPRRILEEAGVGRDLFGQAKRPVPGRPLHKQRDFMRPRSRRDYFDWLRANRARLGAPRWISPGRDRLRFAAIQARLALHRLLGAVPGLGRTGAWQGRRDRLLARRDRPAPLRRYRAQWALERATAAYGEPDGGHR